MKELPGNVFIGPQLLPKQVQLLAEQGIVSLINNRPDMEAPLQPVSDDISAQTAVNNMNYAFIPMAGGLTPNLIAETVKAYENLPRPIYAFCASGTRSTALWCFAHVKTLGVDGVLDAAAQAGYRLDQMRGALTDFAERDS